MNRTPLAIILVVNRFLTACGGAPPAADPPASPVPNVTVLRPSSGTPVSAAPARTVSPGTAEVQSLTIDLRANPNQRVRVDGFSVPDSSRSEFDKTMHENAAFLAKLPGFRGHVVFERTGGRTTFNIVTVATWESPEAMKNAGDKVRDEYQRTGFDMQGTMARWGVTASLGDYSAPKALQGATAVGFSVPPLTIDLKANPSLQFRFGAFAIPPSSRSEFEKTMHENAEFISKLPGFKGHVVFEKVGGPTTFDIVVLAAWESLEAMKDAGEKVRDYYQSVGFNMMGTIARWGVTASDGSYRAPLALQ